MPTFNGKFLNGTEIGVNDVMEPVTLKISAKELGLKNSDQVNVLDITSKTNAITSLKVIDDALQKCLYQQSTIGETISRLDYESANNQNVNQNNTSIIQMIQDILFQDILFRVIANENISIDQNSNVITNSEIIEQNVELIGFTPNLDGSVVA